MHRGGNDVRWEHVPGDGDHEHHDHHDLGDGNHDDGHEDYDIDHNGNYQENEGNMGLVV